MTLARGLRGQPSAGSRRGGVARQGGGARTGGRKDVFRPRLASVVARHRVSRARDAREPRCGAALAFRNFENSLEARALASTKLDFSRERAWVRANARERADKVYLKQNSRPRRSRHPSSRVGTGAKNRTNPTTSSRIDAARGDDDGRGVEHVHARVEGGRGASDRRAVRKHSSCDDGRDLELG